MGSLMASADARHAPASAKARHEDPRLLPRHPLAALDDRILIELLHSTEGLIGECLLSVRDVRDLCLGGAVPPALAADASHGADLSTLEGSLGALDGALAAWLVPQTARPDVRPVTLRPAVAEAQPAGGATEAGEALPCEALASDAATVWHVARSASFAAAHVDAPPPFITADAPIGKAEADAVVPQTNGARAADGGETVQPETNGDASAEATPSAKSGWMALLSKWTAEHGYTPWKQRATTDDAAASVLAADAPIGKAEADAVVPQTNGARAADGAETMQPETNGDASAEATPSAKSGWMAFLSEWTAEHGYTPWKQPAAGAEGSRSDSSQLEQLRARMFTPGRSQPADVESTSPAQGSATEARERAVVLPVDGTEAGAEAAREAASRVIRREVSKWLLRSKLPSLFKHELATLRVTLCHASLLPRGLFDHTDPYVTFDIRGKHTNVQRRSRVAKPITPTGSRAQPSSGAALDWGDEDADRADEWSQSRHGGLVEVQWSEHFDLFIRLEPGLKIACRVFDQEVFTEDTMIAEASPAPLAFSELCSLAYRRGTLHHLRKELPLLPPQHTARHPRLPGYDAAPQHEVGKLTLKFEVRLVPSGFETLAKGRLVPLTLRRPKDARQGHAASTVGTIGLRLKVWDGTKDEDLGNVLWHDWEKQAGDTFDELWVQAGEVLKALPPLDGALATDAPPQ